MHQLPTAICQTFGSGEAAARNRPIASRKSNCSSSYGLGSLLVPLVVLSLSSRRLSGPERNAQEATKAAITLQKALTPLVAVLHERHSQLLLVGSPPQSTCPQGQSFAMLYGRGGPTSVSHACSPTRRQALRLNEPLHQVFKALAVRHPQTVTYFSILEQFCSPTAASSKTNRANCCSGTT